jgi:hypothetical protein
MNEQFTYDVFLSHSAHDTATARALAERLRSDGLRVWFAEWELKPREQAAAKQKKIEHGLVQVRIPTEVEHRFRLKLTTHSERC